MPYTIDDCPHFGCGDCMYSGNRCKRGVDGVLLEFYRPYFLCQVIKTHIPCSDFEHKNPQYADMRNWTDFSDFWEVYKNAWLCQKTVWFFVGGDHSVSYSVPVEQFVFGEIVKGGRLCATKKHYYKRTNSGCGYKLITEDINGVDLNVCENK